MLKVMIVDDEIIVRVGILSCIRWEDYGCEVTAVCESAEEAIACMEKQVPDILFTDIMMPGMNGIELVRYAAGSCPQVKVVVLSCVNEIDYVKKALKLGAEDYILKLSFTRETLAELLTGLRAAIEGERKTRGAMDVYANIRTFNREEAFRTLLRGKLNLKETEALLDKLGYHYNPFEQYQVACLLVDRCPQERAGNRADRDIMQYGLLNIIREYFAGLPESELFFVDDQVIMAVFRLADGEQIPEQFEEIMQRLNHALKTHLNLMLSTGCLRQKTERQQLADACRQARRLASLRFFDGNGSFHSHEDPSDSGVLIRRSVQKAFQEAVFKQHTEQVEELIAVCFAEWKQHRNFERIAAIRRAVVETWIYITGYSLSEQEEMEEIAEFGSCSKFWEARLLDELKDGFRNAVLAIMDYLQANKHINSEIAQLLFYLEAHVGDNISLEQAAGYCALGKSQFCILFKKTTGETFINYFNRLKMKKAYALLNRANIQVQEAANQVGIRDISYFSRLFKKYYQISPSEIKKQ